MRDLRLLFLAVPDAPWPEGMFMELGEAGPACSTNQLSGNIPTIGNDDWSADNDAYHVTFPSGGYVSFVLDWAVVGGDYDALIYCEYEDANNPLGYYRMPFGPGTADLTQPESGTSDFPLAAGADCFFFVVG